MFTHIHTITPSILTAETTPQGRYYTLEDGTKYPSITTILGAKDKPWLRDWRDSLGHEIADAETKRAADRGDAVHRINERELKNDPNPTAGELPAHIQEFNSVKRHLREINNIYAQEMAMYSRVLKVAGRVDVIAEWARLGLSVIDFKTSTNDKWKGIITDYYLQATAYALMFHEMYGIQIDNIVIVMTVEKGMVPMVFKEKVENWIEPLVERINTYYSSKK